MPFTQGNSNNGTSILEKTVYEDGQEVLVNSNGIKLTKKLLENEKTVDNQSVDTNSFTGKRFTRRARRWAELQQKRSGSFINGTIQEALFSRCLTGVPLVISKNNSNNGNKNKQSQLKESNFIEKPRQQKLNYCVTSAAELAAMGVGLIQVEQEELLNSSYYSSSSGSEDSSSANNANDMNDNSLWTRNNSQQTSNEKSTKQSNRNKYSNGKNKVIKTQIQQYKNEKTAKSIQNCWQGQDKRLSSDHLTKMGAPLCYHQDVRPLDFYHYYFYGMAMYPQQPYGFIPRCGQVNAEQFILPSMHHLNSSVFPEDTIKSQSPLSSSGDELMMAHLVTDLSTTSLSSNSSESPGSCRSSVSDDSCFLGTQYYDFAPSKVDWAHNTVNTAPPPERSWIMLRQAERDRPVATFTVLCYNVLCDKYATSTLYSYCPTWALNWEYRKNSIIKEIRHYDADIITLQEVETEQFRSLFQPELESLGYAGIFSPKSRAKTMTEEERKYVDGCAIFWKFDKFEMDQEHLIEFTQVAINKAQTSEHMLNRVMPKDNIALCAVLKLKEGVYANAAMMAMSPNENVAGNPLVVCTAHIHWDPEFCDVKLVQSMMLVQEMSKVLHQVAAAFRITPQQTPVLICGDFNSLPDSGVYEYLAKGAISRNHPDLKGFREDACLEKLSSSPEDTSNYTHCLRMESACDPSLIPFTNYTLDFKGMIDYIFATPQSLSRLGVLGPLDTGWIQKNKIIGFPHPHIASDHISIMSQFAIVPTGLQRTPMQIQHFGASHSSGYGSIGR